MYRLSFDKIREVQRFWALPDRVFFACGACHILAYAFLKQYKSHDFKAVWIRPSNGYNGNHIFISGGDWVFDYHGYSRRDRFHEHTLKKASRWWSGWDSTLVELPPDVLVSEAKSKTVDGLWLREPGQFPHNPLPRARAFLRRFPAPNVAEAALSACRAKRAPTNESISDAGNFISS